MKIMNYKFFKYSTVLISAVLVLTFVTKIGFAGDQQSREYHLKAAFLRYVAKFVEWPAETFPEPKINICILGQVPSYRGISSIDGKVVNDRTIVVSKIANYKEAIDKNCHIMFVSKTESEDVDEIVKFFYKKPVLTFGDLDDFAKKGGSMNFYIVNNRLAIMINPPSMDDAQLKISPRMLRLVTVVPPIDQSGAF